MPTTPAPVAGPPTSRAVRRAAGVTLCVVAVLAVGWSARLPDRSPDAPAAAPLVATTATADGRLPREVHVVGAERRGDVLFLKVDPAGSAHALEVMVAAGAVVVAGPVLLGTGRSGVVPVQALVDFARDPGRSADREHAVFQLGYDGQGEVDHIAEAAVAG